MRIGNVMPLAAIAVAGGIGLGESVLS